MSKLITQSFSTNPNSITVTTDGDYGVWVSGNLVFRGYLKNGSVIPSSPTVPVSLIDFNEMSQQFRETAIVEWAKMCRPPEWELEADSKFSDLAKLLGLTALVVILSSHIMGDSFDGLEYSDHIKFAAYAMSAVFWAYVYKRDKYNSIWRFFAAFTCVLDISCATIYLLQIIG